MLHSREPFYALRDHVSTSLRSVFNRPRFKMRAEAHEGWDILISKDDHSYNLSIGVDEREVSIYVMTVEEHPRMFYRVRFRPESMMNLRKIGITIANKIKNRPIYEVHSS